MPIKDDNKLILNVDILYQSDACRNGLIWFHDILKKARRSMMPFLSVYKKAPLHYKAWAMQSLPIEYCELILRTEPPEMIKTLLTTKLVPDSYASGTVTDNIICRYGLSRKDVIDLLKEYIRRHDWGTKFNTENRMYELVEINKE